MEKVRILAALGNPGPEYAGTRHNLGFMLADRLASEAGSGWRGWKGEGDCAEAELGGVKVWLFKPMTYMNNSGLPLRRFAEMKGAAPSGLLVCYDELALPFGSLRVRPDGSSGGHKGLASIINHFGTQEIARLRMGIGPRPERRDASDFVLGNFSKEERSALPAFLDRAAAAAAEVFGGGVEKAMNAFNNAV